MSAPPITIPGTEVHQLHSDIVGDDYEISVIPPLPGFATGPVPVVYVLDASLQIGLANSTVQQLTFGGEIGAVYVIGIGYPGGAELAVLFQKRSRDLTPSPNDELAATTAAIAGTEGVPTGGGQAFVDFLTTELRPWVQERYAVTGDSTLIGHSAGALFASWVLFKHTAAFQRYLIGSPAALGDDDPLRWEAEYAESHSDMDAAVFLAAGTDEAVPGPRAPEAQASEFARLDPPGHTRQLGETLASRNYPGLRLTTHIVPGITHWTISGYLFPSGLRYVLADA